MSKSITFKKDGIIYAGADINDYRTQAITPIENSVITTKPKKKFEIFDVTNIKDSDTACPFCNYYYPKKSFHTYETICSFNNPFRISGYFWWKKYCNIGGVHGHYICTKCYCHLIRKSNVVDINKIDKIIV